MYDYKSNTNNKIIHFLPDRDIERQNSRYSFDWKNINYYKILNLKTNTYNILIPMPIIISILQKMP